MILPPRRRGELVLLVGALLLLLLLTTSGARAQTRCAADADCDDGDACTTDTCNVITNECEVTVVPGCCAHDYECRAEKAPLSDGTPTCPRYNYCDATAGQCFGNINGCPLNPDQVCVYDTDVLTFPSSFDCLDGSACASTAECAARLPPGDLCYAAVCDATEGCLFQRADCGTGQTCDPTTGTCVPRPCSANGDCYDSRRDAACGDPLIYFCVNSECVPQLAARDPACDLPDTVFCTRVEDCPSTPGDCTVPTCRAPGVCEYEAVQCPRGQVCENDACVSLPCASDADCPYAAGTEASCVANVCNSTSGRCEATAPVTCALDGTEFCNVTSGTCQVYTADDVIGLAGEKVTYFTPALAFGGGDVYAEQLGVQIVVTETQQTRTTTALADSVLLGPVIYSETTEPTELGFVPSFDITGTILDDEGNPISVTAADLETTAVVMEYDATTSKPEAGLTDVGSPLTSDAFFQVASNQLTIDASSSAGTFWPSTESADQSLVYVQATWDTGDFTATTVTGYSSECVLPIALVTNDVVVLSSFTDPCASTFTVEESLTALNEAFLDALNKRRAVLQPPPGVATARLVGLRFIASPNATFLALGEIRLYRIPRGIPRNVSTGCTVGYGYLRNNATAQQLLADALGASLDLYLHGQTLDEALKSRPKRGDAYVTLLHQWLTYAFNSLVGAFGVPAATTAATDAADATARFLLAETGPGLLRPGAAQRAEAIDVAGQLHEYNEGLLAAGPFACEAYPADAADAAETALLDGQAASEARERGAWDWAYETDDATGLPGNTLNWWGVAAVGAVVGLCVGLTALAATLTVQRVRAWRHHRRAALGVDAAELTELTGRSAASYTDDDPVDEFDRVSL